MLLFIFIVSILRGMFNTYSLIYIYKMGIGINNVLLFLLFTYIISIFVNLICFKINKKILYVISCLLYLISFYVNDIYLLCILWSISMYSYHIIRHSIGKDKSPYLMVILTYIGSIISLIMGIRRVLIIIFSFISLYLVNELECNNYNKKIKIDKKRILFFIFEQFKVIFMELEPLYLYLYIDNSYKFVGIYNIILICMSLLVFIFIGKRVDIKYFRLSIYLLGLVFLFKLNIINRYMMLVISIFEGIMVKVYEVNSLKNLYNRDDLRVALVIFSISKALILLIFIICGFSLKVMMYMCIAGMFMGGKVIKSIYY